MKDYDTGVPWQTSKFPYGLYIHELETVRLMQNEPHLFSALLTGPSKGVQSCEGWGGEQIVSCPQAYLVMCKYLRIMELFKLEKTPKVIQTKCFPSH